MPPRDMACPSHEMNRRVGTSKFYDDIRKEYLQRVKHSRLQSEMPGRAPLRVASEKPAASAQARRQYVYRADDNAKVVERAAPHKVSAVRIAAARPAGARVYEYQRPSTSVSAPPASDIHSGSAAFPITRIVRSVNTTPTKSYDPSPSRRYSSGTQQSYYRSYSPAAPASHSQSDSVRRASDASASVVPVTVSQAYETVSQAHETVPDVFRDLVQSRLTYAQNAGVIDGAQRQVLVQLLLGSYPDVPGRVKLVTRADAPKPPAPYVDYSANASAQRVYVSGGGDGDGGARHESPQKTLPAHRVSAARRPSPQRVPLATTVAGETRGGGGAAPGAGGGWGVTYHGAGVMSPAPAPSSGPHTPGSSDSSRTGSSDAGGDSAAVLLDGIQRPERLAVHKQWSDVVHAPIPKPPAVKVPRLKGDLEKLPR